MKCKYCHKNVRSIAHFMQAHKKLMLAKMHRARGKGSRSHSRSRKGHRGGNKRSEVSTGGFDKLTLIFHD